MKTTYATVSNVSLALVSRVVEYCALNGWKVLHVVFVGHAQIQQPIQTSRNMQQVTPMYACICSSTHEDNVTPLPLNLPAVLDENNN